MVILKTAKLIRLKFSATGLSSKHRPTLHQQVEEHLKYAIGKHPEEKENTVFYHHENNFLNDKI